jgi:long-chain acyl-CoA synthetase
MHTTLKDVDRPWFAHYDSNVSRSLDYPDITLYQAFDKARREFASSTATIFYGSKHTYAYIGADIDYFAGGLRRLGVSRGDRVAIMLPNCPQFIIAFYAILKLGAVVVPTNPLYVERELEHQLNDSGAKVIVALDLLLSRIQNVRQKTSLQHVILTSISEEMSPVYRILYKLKMRRQSVRASIEKKPGVMWFRELFDETGPQDSKDEGHPDDLAMLQYTGGTTGISKGAMLTHKNVVANVEQNVAWRSKDLKPGKNTIFCVLPFFHVYGLTGTLCCSVRVGARMVLVPRFDVKDTLKAIHKYRPELFAAVPTILVSLNSYPDLDKYRLDSIKSCNCGAAPLPVEALEQFEKRTGVKILEGYGLSEASPGTHSNPYSGMYKQGSVGIPLPDTDSKIVDMETGERELAVGEPGELIILGPQVMKGYWNQPKETAASLRDGWLYTGDIAKMDSDGYFYIIDRKKDMIIAGGFNIYPREVDEVLFQNPKIKEAVAVGIPDTYRGETVKAFVVLKDGETATEDEIIRFCRERLARYKAPTDVEFRSELPKTLVGKILRKALREEDLKKREKKD